MPRFSPYIGILAALFLGVVGAALSTNGVPSSIVSFATSTLAVAPGTATTQVEQIATTTGATASSTSAAAAPTKAKSVAAAQPAAPATPRLVLSNVAAPLQGALVNILCFGTMQVGGKPRVASGSGVFIDSKGIILTNAHVAQLFLLKDRGMNCVIRTESPATTAYTAALIYISPLWLRDNAGILTKTDPSGTGEYDFALVAVTGSATQSSLPDSFPHVPLALKPPSIGTSVAIASYGAQSLNLKDLKGSLLPTLVFGSVQDVFTFGTNTIDIFEIVGSAASQEGSSGGGVVDASGKLVGTITTSVVKGDIASRSLFALTASYIRGEYASETGRALDLLLAAPTASSVADFAPKISKLAKIITAHLD